MKSPLSLLFVVAFLGAGLRVVTGADNTSHIGISVKHPQRDLTLIANPASYAPSPFELARVKARILKADQAAARSRIAAIEARIRRIEEESEIRIKELSTERESLIKREKEFSETLERTIP